MTSDTSELDAIYEIQRQIRTVFSSAQFNIYKNDQTLIHFKNTEPAGGWSNMSGPHGAESEGPSQSAVPVVDKHSEVGVARRQRSYQAEQPDWVSKVLSKTKNINELDGLPNVPVHAPVMNGIDHSPSPPAVQRSVSDHVTNTSVVSTRELTVTHSEEVAQRETVGHRQIHTEFETEVKKLLDSEPEEHIDADVIEIQPIDIPDDPPSPASEDHPGVQVRSPQMDSVIQELRQKRISTVDTTTTPPPSPTYQNDSFTSGPPMDNQDRWTQEIHQVHADNQFEQIEFDEIAGLDDGEENGNTSSGDDNQVPPVPATRTKVKKSVDMAAPENEFMFSTSPDTPKMRHVTRAVAQPIELVVVADEPSSMVFSTE